jgi:hypothetical protein
VSSDPERLKRVNEARASLDAAHAEARRAQLDALAGRRRVRDARSTAAGAAPALERAQAALRELEAQRLETRGAVRAASDAYARAVGSWLGDDGENDFERLAASYPILLFPVRLEIRFFVDARSPELRVRIYPDEILADAHEPELTAAEQTAGQQFWTAGWDPAKERAAWQALLGTMSPTRAAWVVRVTTPDNLDTRPTAPPVFHAVRLKDANWSRSVHARLLPDRWIVICMRDGTRIASIVTRPVVTPLALTLSPAVQADDAADLVDISGDGLMVDRDMLWTVDFAEAERAGMAARVPISADDARTGFDRVYAIGVRGSLAPEAAAAEIEALIDCHHYGRGFAFVPQGTPTNNLAGAPAGYPTPDPDGTESFRVERGPAQATAGTDAAFQAQAIGIAASVFEHVAGADRIEQKRAAAMNMLLWPVTWGYFFEQFMHAGVERSVQAAVRDYFIATVRGRGPLPLFRVGGTPYGVLAVSGISSWRAGDGESAVSRGLPAILRALLPQWTQAASQVPRAGRSGDPDRDLVELLELDASAREVWIRNVFGPDLVRNLGAFLRADVSGARADQDAVRRRLATLFGEAVSRTRLIGGLIERDGKRFNGGLVSDLPVSTEETLDFNYLAWLKPPTTVEDIRQEKLPAGVSRPGSLLYRLVRQALLLLYRSVALDLQVKAKRARPDDAFERELVGIVDGAESRKTSWQHFAQTIPNVTGSATLGEYLPQAALQQRAMESPHAALGAGRSPVRATPEVVPIKDYLIALETLQNVPTAELELLTGETLDCCSHRIDAWFTSLATGRLARMRADKPRGAHVGAFGWVEDLRPDLPSRLREIGDDGARMQVDSGGYVHAPTLDHAAASAILRNAYLTRSGEARAPYALDLSSKRARLARWMMASVREGQPLTVLLGYRFERGLHDRRLDRFIEPLRRRFPLPNTTTAVSTTAQQSIAPRDVVHGIELQRAWKAQALDLGTLTVPAPDNAERAGLSEELTRLDENADAVADLLTADSVYQLVRGTHSRAGASLDAVAADTRPPEGDFVEAPRGSTALTHRVALVLGGDPPTAPPGWDAPASPRSKAEPALDAWLGTQLGDPASVRARVLVPAPTINAPDAMQTVPLTLRDLRLRPIDFVALLPVSGAQPQPAVLPHADDRANRGAELELRIAAAALGANPQKGIIRLELGRDTASGPDVRSFAEVLEVGRALKAFVSAARPLRPADLLSPEHAGEAASADLMAAESDQRAASAATALDDCITALEQAVAAIPVINPGDPEPNLAPLRAALRAATLLGAPEAFPALPNNVYAQARTLLDARIAAAEAASPPVDLAPLRDALRRARDLGMTIDPPQIVEAGVNADSVATLLVAHRVSSALETKIAADTGAARVALLALGGTVRDALVSRRTAANRTTTAADKLEAIFGPDFVWLPRFKPARSAELGAALTQGPALGASLADKQRWLAQAAQVRAPLRRWRRLALYAGVMRTSQGPFDLAQLPHVGPARWVGLPFPNESERPPAGRVSLALFRAVQPPATDPWCGLVIDEWPEVIPASTETGGLTFHYDDPGAEAAQTLLLAVPPAPAETWSLDALVAILDDTLTMAKVRGVHGEQLQGLGQVLPAIYLAANAAGDTVSAHLVKDRVAATRMIFEEP